MIDSPQFPPGDEVERQAAIDELLIDPLLRTARVEWTQGAARAFQTPMAAITLLGRERQVFAVKVGIEEESTSRDLAFCNWSIQTPAQVTVIEDALADPRVSSHPFVQGSPSLRFYAGAPLTLSGVTIGAICVLDTKPRRPTPDKVDALQRLARDVMLNLDSRFFRRGARPLPPPSVQPPEADAAARGHVLAVDDSNVMLLLLVSQLEIAGFTVVGVASGEAAIAAAKLEAFDAVVLDIQMAGMSGLAVAPALRADPQTRAVPIALCSAHDEDEVGSPSADYDVFLKKPIESVTLGLTLDKLIRTGSSSKLRAPRAR